MNVNIHVSEVEVANANGTMMPDDEENTNGSSDVMVTDEVSNFRVNSLEQRVNEF